jgi:hypothetical protein
MANGEEHGRVAVGSHSFQDEETDVIRIWLVGDVRASDARALLELLDRHRERDTPVFILVDVSRLGSMLPEARKVASLGHHVPTFANVIVGASALQRSALKLLDLAYRLVTKDPNAAPMVFVRTEAEGRAWIEQHRREAARGAPTP